MPWSPPESEAWYYSHKLTSTPFSQQDPTCGRASLPRNPRESQMRAPDSPFDWRDGKVALDKQGKHFVSYATYQKKGIDRTSAPRASIVLVHGINDYGAKLLVHSDRFLDAGYRLIIPDLPAHGRSSGVHVLIDDLDVLADAVYLVLADVVKHDVESNAKEAATAEASPPAAANADGDPTDTLKPIVETSSSGAGEFKQKEKFFVAGQSMGGFSAILTCLKFGSPKDTKLPVDVSFRPEITGGVFLCPMLAISPESRPPYIIELIARGLASIAPALPLADANKGKNSEDPEVEEEFLADPMTYHGKLRIATGLGCLKAIEKVNKLVGELKMPFTVHHGTGDRVTNCSGSERLVREAGSDDKQLKLYDGYEHILLRKGRDEADDVRRQTVLTDILDWLERH